MPPYASEAQRRLFHAKENRGEISRKTVREFDKASKGRKLPEYARARKASEKDHKRRGGMKS